MRLAAAPSSNNTVLVVAALLGIGMFTLGAASGMNRARVWPVKEYFGMTVGQTIETWSIMETIISVVGLLVVLLPHLFL